VSSDIARSFRPAGRHTGPVKVAANSEYGRLRAVLLARCHPSSAHESPEGVADQEADELDYEIISEQQAYFELVLKQHGVAVYWLDPISGRPHQIYARDVATVIGDSFVVCSPRPERMPEMPRVRDFAERIQGHKLYAPHGLVEGGDLLLDVDTLYVGLGRATDLNGLKWLQRNLGDKVQVVPVPFAPEYGHLDMVFNILGREALIYPPAFEDRAVSELKARYNLLEVTPIEQFALGANVLALSPGVVISDRRQRRINSLLLEKGYEVVELECREIAKMKGLFRCMACPLERDAI